MMMKKMKLKMAVSQDLPILFSQMIKKMMMKVAMAMKMMKKMKLKMAVSQDLPSYSAGNRSGPSSEYQPVLKS